MEKYLLKSNLEISIHFMVVSLITWPIETLENVTGHCSTVFLLSLFNSKKKFIKKPSMIKNKKEFTHFYPL